MAPVYAELLSLDCHDRYGKIDLTSQQRKSLTPQTLVDRFLQRAAHSLWWIEATKTQRQRKQPPY